MVPATMKTESKEALNRRLETVGWGLFLVIIGALWLIPAGFVPEGTWLIAAGVIMLGVNGMRYLNDITMSKSTLFLGILAVLFGISDFAGVALPFLPILLILFGAAIILRPWLDPLLER